MCFAFDINALKQRPVSSSFVLSLEIKGRTETDGLREHILKENMLLMFELLIFKIMWHIM